MGQIEDLRLFVDIVDLGSITKASERLNIAKSAVSRRLALLETRYDARLIDRVPGRWAITETGQALYHRAVRAITEIDEIEADFTHTTSKLAGPLSVSVPRDFGLSFLSRPLVAFKRNYPDIALSIDFDDRVIDLDRENYDFAIRITGGSFNDLIMHRIGFVRHALYASPGYLACCGRPQSIEALRSHRLLNYGTARQASWDFEDPPGQPHNMEFQPFLSSNSGLFLLQATLDGLGIARLPDFIAGNVVDDGKLVPVLSKSQIPDWGIYLLFSEHRRLNRRMKLFLDEMKKACMPMNR